MFAAPANRHSLIALTVLIALLLPGCGDGADVDQAEQSDITFNAEPNPQPGPTGLLTRSNTAGLQGPTTPVSLAPHEPYVAGGSPETAREGEDWPQFLGPSGTGVSGETGLMDVWPAGGPPVLWKKRIGGGYSAPSILGNQLVLLHRRGEEDLVECLAADTGERIWIRSFPTHYQDRYGAAEGPRCTPLLTPERLYTMHANGRLSCLSMKDGEVIWMWNSNKEFKVPPGFFGAGSTPILDGYLLIVMIGGHPRSGVVAFNAHTGEVVWENVGTEDWDMKGKPGRRDKELASYSSLAIHEIHGRRHLLALMRPGLISLDPQSGQINFSYYFRSRLRHSVNAAVPVVVDDQIFLSAEYGVGSVLLRVNEDGRSVNEVWKNDEVLRTHFSTPIYLDGHLYAFHGYHQIPESMRCLELATGQLKWKAESAPGETRQHHRGSAVLADGKFIVLDERGTLSLVAATPEKFEEISYAEYPELNYPCWTAPVLSRKRLYIRCEDQDKQRRQYHLLCLDLAADSSE